MSVRLPQPSLLGQVTPEAWEHTSDLEDVEIWRGRTIPSINEFRKRRLYEPSGGFRFLLRDSATNKLVACVRNGAGQIVSYAMLSQDGHYGTALPNVSTDICLGSLGVWTDPAYREMGYGRQAIEGIFSAIQGLTVLNQGSFHVLWVQAHIAHYMRSRARKYISDLDLELLSFERLEERKVAYSGVETQLAI